MTRTSRLALAGAGAALLYGSRAAFRNLGATCEERRKALPGDELVRDAFPASTMAVTIDAPPSAVWPWLLQMGFDRGGFYSWDRLDHGGIPSANEIKPEWQHLKPGDRMLATAGGQAWFEVAEVVPERVLVLYSRVDIGATFNEGTWAFVLEPCDRGTRLIVRARGKGAPRLLSRLANLAFWDPVHVVMQRRQFHNLKRLTTA